MVEMFTDGKMRTCSASSCCWCANTKLPVAEMMATGAPGPLPTESTLWAEMNVPVGTTDVTDLSVMLRPGLKVTGSVQFDGTTLAPPTNLTTLRVALARATPSVGGSSTTATGATFGALPTPSGMARADGTFELLPVYPGTYRLTSQPPPTVGGEWWLRSAIAVGA